MTQALRTAGIAASGHGFRSSFKDWARQHDVDKLLSEFALAYVEGSATVTAYARDDLLEKRRPVMQRWADCIDTWCVGSVLGSQPVAVISARIYASIGLYELTR